MISKLILLALATSPLVAAHGKVAVVTGDAGGNGTALGIRGGVVPGAGPNSVTEVDTTVFRKVNITTDGLGKTKSGGGNQVADVVAAMALSGATLPQISSTNGSIRGVFHIVTTDGAGPVEAVLDPTATGAFASGIKLNTTVQVPGTNGNIKASKAKNNNNKNKRSSSSLWTRAADVLLKRAANVNEDHAMEFSVPDGTTCTGVVNGLRNVCLVKIANSNKAGPFGGVVAVQMVEGSTNNPNPSNTTARVGGECPL